MRRQYVRHSKTPPKKEYKHGIRCSFTQLFVINTRHSTLFVFDYDVKMTCAHHFSVFIVIIL